jgi:hypothetical protein
VKGRRRAKLTHRRSPPPLISHERDINDLAEHTLESINRTHKQRAVPRVPNQVIKFSLVVLDDAHSRQVPSGDHDPDSADEMTPITHAADVLEIVD